MQINLTINLERDELATLVGLLGIKSLDFQAAETAPDASRGANMPAPTETPVLAPVAPVAPATDEGNSAPDAETEPMATFITNTLAAHGLVPLDEWAPAATPAGSATDATLTPPTVPRRAGRPAKRPGDADPSQPGRLPFADFDKLVRSEMKRLSMDGRMPNHRLWNDERNVLLPTMAGVMLRYDCNNLIDLAGKLDMLPPLSALNGQGYRKEPVP